MRKRHTKISWDEFKYLGCAECVMSGETLGSNNGSQLVQWRNNKFWARRRFSVQFWSSQCPKLTQVRKTFRVTEPVRDSNSSWHTYTGGAVGQFPARSPSALLDNRYSRTQKSAHTSVMFHNRITGRCKQQWCLTLTATQQCYFDQKRMYIAIMGRITKTGWLEQLKRAFLSGFL